MSMCENTPYLKLVYRKLSLHTCVELNATLSKRKLTLLKTGVRTYVWLMIGRSNFLEFLFIGTLVWQIWTALRCMTISITNSWIAPWSQPTQYISAVPNSLFHQWRPARHTIVCTRVCCRCYYLRQITLSASRSRQWPMTHLDSQVTLSCPRVVWAICI